MDWFLEEDNPSVRFFTLVELTGRSRRSAEVIEAESQIMKKGVVPKILAKQNEDGYWEEPEKFYAAKYRGTVWQLIILAELGADGNDERIRKACERNIEQKGRPSKWVTLNALRVLKGYYSRKC